jgi:prophage regulatory protein
MEFLFLKELEQVTGLSETTISRMERKGAFPKRVKISARRVAWLKQDVLDWMESVSIARRVSSFDPREAPCAKI